MSNKVNVFYFFFLEVYVFGAVAAGSGATQKSFFFQLLVSYHLPRWADRPRLEVRETWHHNSQLEDHQLTRKIRGQLRGPLNKENR